MLFINTQIKEIELRLCEGTVNVIFRNCTLVRICTLNFGNQSLKTSSVIQKEANNYETRVEQFKKVLKENETFLLTLTVTTREVEKREHVFLCAFSACGEWRLISSTGMWLVAHKLRRSIAENTNSLSNQEEEKRRRSKQAATLLPYCCRKKTELIN